MGQPLGSCNAIIASISTKIDRSIKITLEVNPEDQQLVSKLMKIYLEGDSLVTVGFVKADE